MKSSSIISFLEIFACLSIFLYWQAYAFCPYWSRKETYHLHFIHSSMSLGKPVSVQNLETKVKILSWAWSLLHSRFSLLTGRHLLSTNSYERLYSKNWQRNSWEQPGNSALTATRLTIMSSFSSSSSGTSDQYRSSIEYFSHWQIQ